MSNANVINFPLLFLRSGKGLRSFGTIGINWDRVVPSIAGGGCEGENG